MALTFRNPIDEAISCFSSSEQSLIATTAIEGYRNLERDLFHFFNYHMPAFAKEQLIGAGLYLSPYSGVPHSHPVCKTLENDILYRVLPSIIDASYYMVGIKQSKFAFLKQRGQGLDLLGLINRYVTSADKLRYGSEFHVTYSKPINIDGRTISIPTSETISDLVPACISKKARKLFLHDELHYWKLKDLRTFLEIVKPETVLGTLVFPPELLRGIERSLNTWCYDFDIQGGDLLFYPDGVRTEGYCQPLVGGFLLKVNRIILKDGSSYCVDLIYSKFAHHLIAITRGDAVTKKYNCFSNFQATTWKGLSDISVKNFGECIDIPFRVICGIYKYLRTLNKPDVQSAVAKLSQLLPEHTGYHLNFVRAFSELVIKTDSRNYVFKGSLIDEIKAFVGRLFPARLAGMFDVVRAKCLDDFVWMMQEYTFKVELQTLGSNAVVNAIFDDMTDLAIEPQDVLSLMDKFQAPIDPLVHSTWSMEYSLEPYACEVEFSEERLATCIFEFTKSYFLGHCKKPDLGLALEMYFMAKGHIALLHFHKIHDIDNDQVLQALVVLIRKNWYLMAFKGLVSGFEKLGLRWFLLNGKRRVNRRSITDYPDNPKKFLEPECVTVWQAVCSTICSGQGLPFLPELPVEAETHVVIGTTAQHERNDQNIDSTETGSELEAINCFLLFRCICNVELHGQNARGVDLLPMEFPDALHGRRAAWYTKGCDTAYIYNGGHHRSLGWSDELELFLALNDQLKYGYDCVLIQEYDEGSNLGLHADDEDIFEELSPVCTVQVRGTCTFKINCHRHTSSFPLEGSILFTMPAGFQQTHKHGLANARGARISCTFRVLKKTNAHEVPLRPEEQEIGVEQAQETLERSDLEVHTTLFGVQAVDKQINASNLFVEEETIGDGNCFYRACSVFLGIGHDTLRKRVRESVKELSLENFPMEELADGAFVTNASIAVFSLCFAVSVEVYYSGFSSVFITRAHENLPSITMAYSDGHYTSLRPRNDCVITSLMAAFQRPRCDIMGALFRRGCAQLLDVLKVQPGVSIEGLSEIMKALSVRAILHSETGEVHEINTKGRHEFHFKIASDHIEYHPKGGKDLIVHNVAVKKCKEVCPGELELTLACTKINVELFREVAHKLAKTLNAGLTGVLCSSLFNGMEEFVVHMPSEALSVPHDVHFILGVFGCGKSTLYSSALEKGLAEVGTFVTPRKLLAEELRKTVDGLSITTKPKIQTFEIFLRRAAAGMVSEIVIFDECQLYPHGFFDLVIPMIMHKGARKVFLVGDPCQSDYDNEKDRAWLQGSCTDIERFLHDKNYGYYIKSYRFLNPDFEGRLPCATPGFNADLMEPIEFYQSLEEAPVDLEVECLLVASFSEKRAMNVYFQKTNKVMTFGESTGLTFNSVAIFVSESATKTTERRWITALTRSRNRCIIISNLGVALQRLELIFKDRVLGRFLSRTATLGDLQQMLPGKPHFIEELKDCRIGKDHGIREEKLRGDPWLKTMIFLGQNPDVCEEELQEPESVEEVFKTHLPRNELESIRAKWVDRFKAKENRECRFGSVVSDQFAEDHHRNSGKILSNAAERFEAIYPRHKSGDTATFIMAARKRLRFSNPKKEMGKFKKSQVYGPSLLNEFLKRVPLRAGHNSGMMEKAIRDFEDKKTSKSAAIIENHAGRSSADWPIDQGLVFMKSQLCTKFENRFRDAKAAQSIVCFSHAVLCRFAPYMRYIEQKVIEALPEKYYIHSGKGLDQLNDWVLRGGFNGLCTESDYEAFDASQDQYILAFEVELMHYLGIPKDLIQDYLFIKTHLGSKLGNFAIMRFSGEASTFLFNTLANMLFTFLRYDLNGRERICFAGDDMCANQRLRVSEEHQAFLDLLKLKAKVQFTSKPTFCGWNLTKHGIFKKPQLILERCCIAKERNVLSDCIDNYAIELGYAYKLKELAVSEMDEEEADAYFNCVKIIIKNKHLLKSEVRKLYEA